MENTSNIDVSQDSGNGLSEILSLFLTSSEENNDNNGPMLSDEHGTFCSRKSLS